MKYLEDMIRENGEVRPGGIVKVDGFLNHRLDWCLYREMGAEFFRLFSSDNVSLILTIEASGIGIACVTAQFFEVPVVFAKKAGARNMDKDVYTASVVSFTHGSVSEITVNKKYISPSDRVLIIDDFLANGEAASGLISIVNQAGASLVGVGIAVEKCFQSGGDKLRASGIHLESLALIESTDNGIVFRK
ncbi:MAG: xanthine phosphoribosyltransferase [Clostridiales bacterium]|jgi:xanthine phosphoribosyltransferase|nr:xanthine phosphoribosyltransferase [Clostridiales bacterium]